MGGHLHADQPGRQGEEKQDSEEATQDPHLVWDAEQEGGTERGAAETRKGGEALPDDAGSCGPGLGERHGFESDPCRGALAAEGAAANQARLLIGLAARWVQEASGPFRRRTDFGSPP